MINSKQLKNGNRDEKLICELFKNKGYWAHNFAKSSSGSQPVDIIAVKGNILRDEVWLLDVKNVREQECSFPFKRIEPNQLACFKYARSFANIQRLGFAICFERADLKPFWLSYDKYLELNEKGQKSVNLSDLEPLEDLLCL